jgi:hypothetical protein
MWAVKIWGAFVFFASAAAWAPKRRFAQPNAASPADENVGACHVNDDAAHI